MVPCSVYYFGTTYGKQQRETVAQPSLMIPQMQGMHMMGNMNNMNNMGSMGSPLGFDSGVQVC